MKKSFFFLFLTLCFFSSFASHIIGGEMTYEYLGPGTDANTSQYRITLKLFRDQNCIFTDPNCAPMPDDVFIGIYNNDDNSEVFSGRTPYFDVTKSTEDAIPVTGFPPCINNPPDLNYHVATYTFTVTLNNNQKGYTAAYQTCCRVKPLANVFNSASGGTSGTTGATYSCLIPGANALGSGHNSSPQFATAISIICQGKPFSLNFSATDPDGTDSLVYYFCNAFDGGLARDARNINPSAPTNITPPQYNSVQYIGGFSGDAPLGGAVSINPSTGMVSGVAPGIGKYVLCVCVNEYRQGKQIGYHRKDFIVNVNDCDFSGALLAPSYITCDQYSYTLQNQNNSSQNHTFFWDAGPAGTSSSPVATFTFPDTGVYNVKLVVNRGEPCSDSTNTKVSVFPGFSANFSTSGICQNKPTFFTDSSVAKYGTVNSWSWDFGVNNTSADVSSIKNPSYTFTQTGTYYVQLIAGSSKGCIDTVQKPITIIDKPPISLAFRDTLICNGDALQLMATGSGKFSWTPLAHITNENTATPTVTPAATTWYVAKLDDNGCINTDSVRVRVVDFVTLQPPPNATICATDSIRLVPVSNGLQFAWTPADYLNNAHIKSPTAAPAVTTQYQVTATIGHCSTTAPVQIRAVPYPVAHAGADTIICYGTTAQLKGSMQASSFSWTPANTLSQANTLSPIAHPLKPTDYILTVFDTLGCPKPGRDTVRVTVLDKIPAFAGRDTAVIVNQPLQFNGSGGNKYSWTPATGLNRTDIPNPVGLYDGSFDSIRYQLRVTKITDGISCVDSATVGVKIFSTRPQVFVPSGFTPNGDSRNDVFRPIAVGISRIEYFRVFNRWGQMVFSTTVNGQGWDGRINGKEQGTGVYVWLVKGIDYLGKEFFAKGTVTLIR